MTFLSSLISSVVFVAGSVCIISTTTTAGTVPIGNTTFDQNQNLTVISVQSERQANLTQGNSTNYTTSLSIANNPDVASSRQAVTRIPQVNFYQSIPNALGVIGQGIIWLREISAALGTPIPIWIFTLPFFIVGVGLMFIPDNTKLHQPLFYPSGGGDGDPLAGFPPLTSLEGITGIDILNPSEFLSSNFIFDWLG